MNNFPTKTALALTTAIATLAIAHHFAHEKGLSPAIFAEAAHLNLIRHAPSTHPAATVATKTPPPAPIGAKADGTPCPILPGVSAKISHRPVSPYLIDDCGTLDPFFAALHALELPGKDTDVVTVLHYGDSPTTADLITGDVRELLQSRFGDAGRGYLLAAKPWAWYGHRGVDLSDHGWTTSTAVGKGREETYGLGGASFEGAPGASTHIAIKAADQTTLELAYLAKPNGGTLDIAANDTPVESIPTAADANTLAWHTTTLPPNTKTIDLKTTGASVRLFGETLRTGHRGVLYNSLGLNGASTSVLSNGFNNAAWAAALQHTRPALVIINYGTNESGFGSYVDKQYEPTLRTAIARIRAALPNEPILVMSPMDRGQRSGVDEIKTYDTIPRIIAIQRRVAAELNCAFFDTFNAMGGDGTMSRWYTGHPRLVAGDLIHPTPQGAAIVANLFVKDLAAGYERYLGHQAPAAPVSPAKQPAPTPAPPTQQAPEKPASPPQPAPDKPVPPPLKLIPKPKPSAAGEPVPSTPEPPKPDPKPETPAQTPPTAPASPTPEPPPA